MRRQKLEVEKILVRERPSLLNWGRDYELGMKMSLNVYTEEEVNKQLIHLTTQTKLPERRQKGKQGLVWRFGNKPIPA